MAVKSSARNGINGFRVGKVYLRPYRFGPGIAAVWVMSAVFIGLSLWRWIVGLGPTTNLNDGRPWGLWIAFDMMSGIGLAAGAFTIAAVVYIFHLKQFYPIVRPTILTGFISYLLGALTLMVDLSQPWRIWHLIIYSNIHSPLFEIGWCVMLYLTVLALEFSPELFEALGWKVPLKWIRSVQTPIIIAGITLSTMHQSTLGTMMLIMPDKVHPLWYTPLIPGYYYVSAIAAGLGMTVMESYLSSRAYDYPFELKILSRLVKIIPWLLGSYLVFKVGELIVTREYLYLLQGGMPAVMFLLEMTIGVIIPIIYFADPNIRKDIKGLVWGSFFVMSGLVLNRMNTALVFLEGSAYAPSWQEILLTVGLSCLGVLLFDLAVRFLPIFPEPTPEAVENL